MPNLLSSTGLQTATQAELFAQLSAQFKAIYGSDINLDPSSPDAQMLYIFIQATLDNLDLMKQIYSSFDPDQAFGVTLDQRVAINGIQRQAGTYTVTPITVVASQALNLYGLDQSVQQVFTVQDNAGTKWLLQSTQNISGAGTYVYNFRAEKPGATLTTPNTITIPSTIALGVASINNPTVYSVLGIDEESDATLKIRRQKSVSLASQGYYAGLLAALQNINGIGPTNAFVYENNSNATDVNGIPSHSIWVIVAGTGTDAEIANAIYQKRNAGCGMFGAKSFVITQADGSPFIIYWDIVEVEDLYIKFTTTSLNGTIPPDLSAIRTKLPISLVPAVAEQWNVNDLATLVQQIDNNCLVTDAGFSLSPTGPFFNLLAPSAKNKQFVVSSPNVILLPMQLSPPNFSVVAAGTHTFTPLGGYGSYTYSFTTNVTGGTFVNGLYTAGVSAGTDVLKVTDSQGNYAEATVIVV